MEYKTILAEIKYDLDRVNSTLQSPVLEQISDKLTKVINGIKD